MKIELSDTPLLSTQQIGELASTLDLLHKRTLTAIERLNKDIATRKQQIAARWKTAPGIGMADVARFTSTRPWPPSARSRTTPRPSWTRS